MNRIKTTFVAIFLAYVAVARAFGGNIQYSVTDLGTLGGPSSHPTSMNGQGEVAGYSDQSSSNLYSHGFLYTGIGPLTNLGSFAGPDSVSIATGVTNSGMVVGYSGQPGSLPVIAFTYTVTGGMQPLAALGGAESYAWGTNNSGQIVGQYVTSSGSVDGFIYSSVTGSLLDLGATYAPLCVNDAGLVAAVAGSGTTSTYISNGGTSAWINIGSLGGSFTQPEGMNNFGSVVGMSSVTSSNSYNQPFLYSGGTMADLGTFGGDGGSANAINNLGVVVGYAYLPGDQVGHGFIYYGSSGIEDLNNLIDPSLGWTIDDAVAINDSGVIVAEANQQGEGYHAVLLAPIATPEPSSLCYFCALVFAYIAFRCGARLWRPRCLTQRECFTQAR